MDLTQENLLPFDKPLRNERIKIELLDYNMKAIDSIEGVVINGQISVNANNDIRRTGSITLCVPIDNSKTTFLDSINDVEISADGKIWIDKNIKIYIGIDNKENGVTNTIWYKMGVFLFDQPVRNFSSNNYEISFNCIDRMVLLTGDRQGQFTGVSATIPAGEYVDSSDFNQTQILSPSEEEPLLFGRNMDKNPEGTQIAIIVEDGTVGSGIVKFYELVEGIFTAMSPPLTIPSSGITAVKYRPDGQQFVIATESAGIYIYDCTSVPYTYLGTLSSNVINPISLDFSPDSTEFICGAGIETSNIISRFDTSTTPYTFKSYCSLSGYEKAISKCVYSPDGVLIVCNIAINSINNLDGLPSMIAFQDSTYINFLDEDYYTSYKKSLSRDFCFSSDGKKFTILVDKYPYFLSFQTKIIPYIMDNMPLSIPTQEMYFCKYFDNDTKIFMGISNLRGNDDESYLYSCISNHYVQLSYNPMEINTLINDEIAFNVSQIGFMSNKLLLTGYCTFPRAFSLVCNIIESSTYLRTLTRDALTSVIKDLTTITKFTIAEIPNDFKYLPYDITVTTGDTVNSILKKFKDILSSWQFYFDLDGVFRIEQIRSGVNAPIMPVEYKTYIDGQLTYDFGNVKNQVVIYGKLNDCHKYCGSDNTIYTSINPLETELTSKWLCKKYSFDIYNVQISSVDKITYSQSLSLFAGLKDGDIYTSQNGYTWTKVNDDSTYEEIIWSKIFSKFIAVGELSWTYSLDGITWVADDFDFTMPPAGIVDSGSTIFVGLENDYEVYPDKQCFRYTTDGINWSSISSSVAIDIYSITTSSEKVIAIGRNTETVQPIALEYNISTSILNEFSTGITSQESIAFGLVYDENGNENKIFVSVGSSKKGGYSTDGITWEEITLPLSADYVSFVGNYNSDGDNIARKNVDGYFIASASGKIMSSRNGRDWQIIGTGNFTGIAFNDEKFVGCSGTDCYIGYKNYETLTPEENTNYIVSIYYPNAQPTLKYFTWNGTTYVEQIGLLNINVDYNSNVLTLYFDTFDFSTLTINAFNIGFKSNLSTNLVNIDTVVLYNLENDTQISGTITSFEGSPKYVSANTLEPNEIYIIRVSKAILNKDGKVDTNYPITFELYSRQQPSSCLINDNKESPFYINKNLSGENYYAGVAETPDSLNVGEGYKLTLNNSEELLALENGTLITFLANYTNSYQRYLNYTSVTICSGFDDSIILENIPIVQNELYRSDEGTVRLLLQEGKMSNTYTCYMLKYDSIHSQFIFMGINTSAYSLVLTGGDYDSIYSDQLAYERCLWELYLHSNLQDTISLTIVPNYMLDANMKIPFKKKYQYPISSKATDIDEGYDYYLIKQLSFYFGSSGSGTKVVGLKIYDSGNLLPD